MNIQIPPEMESRFIEFLDYAQVELDKGNLSEYEKECLEFVRSIVEKKQGFFSEELVLTDGEKAHLEGLLTS